LAHLLSSEAFTAYDFRTLIAFFTGSTDAYVVRGYEIVKKSQLTIQIGTADSLVFNPQDESGSFYFGLSNADPISLTLAAEKTFYVEAVFGNQTQNPVNQAFWNPLALNQDDAAGNEFSASTNSQNVLTLIVPAPNLTGFTPGAIPLYKIKTGATQIESIVDCRPMLFRLGTGGSVPNAGSKFPWALQRREPVNIGTAVGQAEDSPFLSKDGSGVLNDKGLTTFKEWMDAVMTRISELTGSPLWYGADISGNYIDGLNLNSIYFDSPGGHSINPSSSATIRWTKTYQLKSEGLEPVEWQANYNGLKWRLGGAFAVDASNYIGSHSLEASPRFTSPIPADGGNLYLRLKRDVPITVQDNPVNWISNSVPFCFRGFEAQVVTGLSGDFKGLAIGDYVRRASEGYSRYYRVVAFAADSSQQAIETDQLIADDSITAIRLSRPIEGGASSEPIRMFQSNYDSSSLVADQDPEAIAAGKFIYPDIDCYWIGRRVGENFILRNYGSLEPGQEIRVLGSGDYGYAYGDSGPADMLLEHAFGACFANGTYYNKKATGTLLTLRRRKRNNEVSTPNDTSNANSLQTFVIQSPGALNFAVGDTLWVKLSENVSGTLTAGSVTNATDDLLNTESNKNVYEVRSSTDAPLRNYDNRDVFQIARCISEGVLQFYDGSFLNVWGLYLNGLFEVKGDAKFDADVYLDIKTPRSVLWVDDLKRIQEDNTNFYYEVAQQYLQVFNHRLGPEYLNIEVPRDQRWLENLGQNTVTIGSDQSTVKVLGNLVVIGKTLAEITPVIVTEDPNLTLGAGNETDGGGGSGISVADATKLALRASAFNGGEYIDITYSSPHGYSIGAEITANTTASVGTIQSGDINSVYTVASGLSTSAQAGTAQIISSTILRLHTGVSSSSTETVNFNDIDILRTFTTPSFIQMTDESGSSEGMTSWGFRVKNVPQTVTLTPVSSYDVVPSAKSVNFSNMRIPFACDDNAGPDGSDTTLDFSQNFIWDNEFATLTVTGTEWVKGVLRPWNTIAQSNPSQSLLENNTVEIRDSIVAPGNTLGSQYSLRLKDLNTAAKNYGLYSEVSAGLDKWNIYVAGTANNYIENALSIGQTDQSKITSRLTIGTSSSVQPGDGILLGSDANLYRLEPGILRTDVALETGQYHRFVNQYAGAPNPPPAGKVSVFASDGLIWQIDSNGVISPLTTPLGNVYEETLFVKADGASGNNQINLSDILPTSQVLAPGASFTLDGPAQGTAQFNGAGGTGQLIQESGLLKSVTFQMMRLSTQSPGEDNPYARLRVSYVNATGSLTQVLGYSDSVPYSNIPSVLGSVTFNFSSPVELDGSTVAIEVVGSGMTGQITAVSNTYTKGYALFSQMPMPQFDLAISVSVDPVEQITLPLVRLPLDGRSLPDPLQRRTYMVNSGELEVYLNGVHLQKDVDYEEIGTAGYPSYTVRLLSTVIMIPSDRLTFRIGTNGGMYMVGGEGAAFSDLQGAYIGGNRIETEPGVPVILDPLTSGDLSLEVRGKANIWDALNAKANTFTKSVVRPFEAGLNGLWVNNQGDLIYNQAGSYNLSEVARNSGTATNVYLRLANYGLTTIAMHYPIGIDRTGSVCKIDPSSEDSASATLGIAMEAIQAGAYGRVVTAGKIENVSITASLGDVLYVAKNGDLTTLKPTIGQNGFVSGDFVIRIGVVTANFDIPTSKDISVSVQIIGQL
jgi:hypothetical protein